MFMRQRQNDDGQNGESFNYERPNVKVPNDDVMKRYRPFRARIERQSIKGAENPRKKTGRIFICGGIMEKSEIPLIY